MLHGHNAHLGWANTVNSPDLADVYRLTTNEHDEYLLDGQWQPLLSTDFRHSRAFPVIPDDPPEPFSGARLAPLCRAANVLLGLNGYRCHSVRA